MEAARWSAIRRRGDAHASARTRRRARPVVVEAGAERDRSASPRRARIGRIFEHPPERVGRDRRRPEGRMLIRHERHLPQPLACTAISPREHREVGARAGMLLRQSLDSGDKLSSLLGAVVEEGGLPPLAGRVVHSYDLPIPQPQGHVAPIGLGRPQRPERYEASARKHPSNTNPIRAHRHANVRIEAQRDCRESDDEEGSIEHIHPSDEPDADHRADQDDERAAGLQPRVPVGPVAHRIDADRAGRVEAHRGQQCVALLLVGDADLDEPEHPSEPNAHPPIATNDVAVPQVAPRDYNPLLEPEPALIGPNISPPLDPPPVPRVEQPEERGEGDDDAEAPDQEHALAGSGEAREHEREANDSHDDARHEEPRPLRAHDRIAPQERPHTQSLPCLPDRSRANSPLHQ